MAAVSTSDDYKMTGVRLSFEEGNTILTWYLKPDNVVESHR